MGRDRDALSRRIDTLQQLRAPDAKPIFVLLAMDSTYTEGPDLGALVREFLTAGIPCFIGMDRSARALSNASGYRRRSAASLAGA
jgi:hypothetical protein